jgi:hypothetical protein
MSIDSSNFSDLPEFRDDSEVICHRADRILQKMKGERYREKSLKKVENFVLKQLQLLNSAEKELIESKEVDALPNTPEDETFTLEQKTGKIEEIKQSRAKLLPLLDKVNDIRTNALKVGNYTFQRIPMDALEPGDIVCTYESTSTVPSVVEARNFQKAISNGSQEVLSRMLHFEIILEKKGRAGCYDVVHASGLRKQVAFDSENYKNYSPCQSIVVFRPKKRSVIKNGKRVLKDNIIKENILDIAKKTMGKGNPWKIRLQDPKITLLEKLKYIAKSFIFERTNKEKATESKIRDAVKLTLDAEAGRGFLEKDGVSLRSLNCAEYAACVINSAAIKAAFKSIIENKRMSEEEKIKKITDTLKKGKQGKDTFTLPLEYNTPEVSSASFVNFMLKNSSDWVPLGYFGTHQDDSKEIYLERTSGRLMYSEELEPLKVLTESSNELILGTLNLLEITNGSNHFIANDSDKTAKFKAAFALLYSVKAKCKPEDVFEFMNDQSREGDIKKINEKFKKFTALLEKQKEIEALKLEELQVLQEDEIDIDAVLTPRVKSPRGEDKRTLSDVFEIVKDKLPFSKKSSQITSVLEIDEIKVEDHKEIFLTECASELELNVEFIRKYIDSKNLKLFYDVKEDFPAFLNTMNNLIKSKNDHQTQDQTPLKVNCNLPLDKQEVLVGLERKIIKQSLEAPQLKSQTAVIDKTEKISSNFFRSEAVRIEKKKNFAKRVIVAGLVGLIIPPVGLVILSIGLILSRLANKAASINNDWQIRFKSVIDTAKPNAKLKLESNVGLEHRPWIHYTIDGENWETEPLWLLGNTVDQWEIKLKIPLDKSFEYKLFKGPANEDHMNPMQEAESWIKTADGKNVVVTRKYMKGGQSLHELPTVSYPVWTK